MAAASAITRTSPNNPQCQPTLKKQHAASIIIIHNKLKHTRPFFKTQSRKPALPSPHPQHRQPVQLQRSPVGWPVPRHPQSRHGSLPKKAVLPMRSSWPPNSFLADTLPRHAFWQTRRKRKTKKEKKNYGSGYPEPVTSLLLIYTTYIHTTVHVGYHRHTSRGHGAFNPSKSGMASPPSATRRPLRQVHVNIGVRSTTKSQNAHAHA
ncbi:hypothetical protein X797_006342 [Metarhizium robertsii]|uniref:Uncharacterized protein n=1 Tax=Metarhizium robertsii TaxID=568076 RepID=A0A014R091_9HYPO|nr:hypothetical protein X797_006342 [Metarhizium robertsii]